MDEVWGGGVDEMPSHDPAVCGEMDIAPFFLSLSLSRTSTGRLSVWIGTVDFSRGCPVTKVFQSGSRSLPFFPPSLC